MSVPPTSSSEPAYRTWQRARVVVGERSLAVATRPGVRAHAEDDPASTMLAEALGSAAGLVVVCMPCGNGLTGAAAARAGAERVYMGDRHAPSVYAARRTLEANGVTGVDVRMGQGVAHFPEVDGAADVVVIRVVPEALTMRILLLDACALLKPGGRCLLAGANAEGARSAAKVMERLFGNVKLLAQRRSHRMVSSIRTEVLSPVPPDLETSYTDHEQFLAVPLTVGARDLSVFTRPGVFSWQHLDEGTLLLLQHMQLAADARVLDLGCGAGVLGVSAAVAAPGRQVRLVDADSEAVRCVHHTLATWQVENATTQVSDVAEAVEDETFDAVITNPPFHVGAHTALAVPRQFMRDAWAVLTPGGSLQLVANRTLPYEQVLHDLFGNVTTVHNGRHFKVLSAIR